MLENLRGQKMWWEAVRDSGLIILFAGVLCSLR